MPKKKFPMGNGFEADLFCAMLKAEDIPFVLVDHSSLVFDGLFQMTMGWGHVEVPEAFEEAAKALYEAMEASMETEKEPEN